MTSPGPQKKRKEARLPTRRRAKIHIGASRPMECFICDISSGGALLQLRTGSWLPRTFQLEDGRGPARDVAVVWEGTNHVGVRFTRRGGRPDAGFGRRKAEAAR